MAAKRKKAAEKPAEDVSEVAGASAPAASEDGSEDGSGGLDEATKDEAPVSPYKVAPNASLCTLSGIKVTGDPVHLMDLSRDKKEAQNRADVLCEKKRLVKN